MSELLDQEKQNRGGVVGGDLPLLVSDVGIGLLETCHLSPHKLVVCAQLFLCATSGRLG